MRHTLSLIVAAIAPLAVIATNPAMTTTESIPGSGQSQVSGQSGVMQDALAARTKAKNTSKKDLRSRAKVIRPRTNRITPIPAEPPGQES
ncbi:MAG: hypothetical protein JNK58_06760 [Phycisphaerae bacterium]|nr:hypothetical protein [Phycisphaerae bacterium]